MSCAACLSRPCQVHALLINADISSPLSVSWVDQSKIRQHIARYTGEHDDYDLL